MDANTMAVSRTISILLVDDYEFTRRGLRSILGREDDIGIVGEADSAREAIALILRLEPDVVLLDIRLREGTGIDVTRAVSAAAVDTKILVLSAYSDDAYVTALARLGINGYLMKSSSARELIKAVRIIAEGGLVYPLCIAEKVKALLTHRGHKWRGGNELYGPTSREAEVMQQMGLGLTNREIAKVIGISARTVEVHIAHLLRKLGAKNRTQAVIMAGRIGLL